MKIGIISDIHGYPEKFKTSLKYFEGCSMILCAGDILYHGPRNPILEGYDPQGLAKEIHECKIPILSARGNCDAEVDLMVLDLPLFLPAVVYEAEGVRFMVLHGHDADDERLEYIAEKYDVDIMITGHTHIRKCETLSGRLFINPGSPSLPKGDGIPSVALCENGEIKFINIETGKAIQNVNI